MNLITLVNHDTVTLASGSLVYDASETNALTNAVQSAEALAAHLASEEARIAEAAEAGRQQGQSEGYADGMAQAQAENGAHLVRLTAEAQAHIEQQREQTLTMALQIVKKITTQFATDEVLVTLARTAARECAADESISLSVHPDQLEAVQQRIEANTGAQTTDAETGRKNASGAAIAEVFADETLAADGCVLHTRYGSVVADLKTRLEAIENNLGTQYG